MTFAFVVDVVIRLMIAGGSLDFVVRRRDVETSTIRNRTHHRETSGESRQQKDRRKANRVTDAMADDRTIKTTVNTSFLSSAFR